MGAFPPPERPVEVQGPVPVTDTPASRPVSTRRMRRNSSKPGFTGTYAQWIAALLGRFTSVAIWLAGAKRSICEAPAPSVQKRWRGGRLAYRNATERQPVALVRPLRHQCHYASGSLIGQKAGRDKELELKCASAVMRFFWGRRRS